MKKNNKGVSAVIGVILMVAITIAIACTVYIYVDNVMHDGRHNIYNESIIQNKYVIDDAWKIKYYFELENNNTKEVSEYIYTLLDIGDTYIYYVGYGHENKYNNMTSDV